MSLSGTLHCKYANSCSGCPLIHLPYETQVKEKKEFIEGLLTKSLCVDLSVKIHSVDKGYLRDRCDLTLKRVNGKMRLGLYDVDRKEVLDLEECQQMSPKLWSAVEKFRKDLPSIAIGSLRFRVSPDGKIGVWLDFPNQTVKQLLEERAWLQKLLTWAYVEVGQKRKRLVFNNDKHQLLEDEYQAWFETYIGEKMEGFPLYGKVGGFSQPGFRANRALLQVLKGMLPKSSFRVIELCSGSGNLTFFLASLGHKVTAVEIEESSLAAVNKSMQHFSDKDNILIQRMNLHGKNPEIKNLFLDKDLVVADPPRSGLGQSMNFFSELSSLPKYFIYISCFPESFIKDTKKLISLGYSLERVEAVDQFPQSKHIELIARLERREP